MGGDDTLDRPDRFWLEEFRQSREDWRHLNSFIWQMPTAAITASGVLLGVAFYGVENLLVRGAISGLTVLLMIALMFSMHRFNSIQLSRQAQCDRAACRLLGGEVMNKTMRRSAYSVMFAVMTALAVLLAGITLGILAGWVE
jgi:hypothetical protein